MSKAKRYNFGKDWKIKEFTFKLLWSGKGYTIYARNKKEAQILFSKKLQGESNG